MKYIYHVTVCSVILYFILTKTIFYYRKPIWKPIIGGLNNYDIVLTVGDTYHLYVFGTIKKAHYKSADPKVATVSFAGGIRAWRAGTTVIQVRYSGKLLKCRVRVVKLNHKSLKLKVGDSKWLRLKHAWLGVRFDSSDKRVVTVNSFGRVKAVGSGNATITVQYRGLRLKCKVTVVKR